MKRHLFVAVLAGALCDTGVVSAQDAHPLTKDELLQLLPGSKVVSTGPTGAGRRWTNEPDGKFLANGSVLGRGASGNAPGDWHVSDDGKYCLHIEWKSRSETWCAFIQKTEGNNYTLVKEGSSGDLPTDVSITK